MIKKIVYTKKINLIDEEKMTSLKNDKSILAGPPPRPQISKFLGITKPIHSMAMWLSS